MIAQAPFSFGVAAVIVGIVIWLFKRSVYNGQITLLNERLKLRDDQLGDLQKKLHAESPADALIKIGELTAKVEALSIGIWDPLTESQLKDVRSRLAKIPPTNLHLMIADDGRALLKGLQPILADLGWNTTGTKVISGHTGIEVYPVCDTADAIAEALHVGGGLTVEIATRKTPESPLTLYIGPKPFG